MNFELNLNDEFLKYVSYVDNYNDRINLQNKVYQIKISANIIKGIVKFFTNNY